MVIDRITSGSRPVAYVEPLGPAPSIADPRQEAFDRLRQMAIGKQFQAEIVARLNDGSFMVRMANSPNEKSPDAGPGGATARMRLPAGAQVGAFLDLTLIAKQPRLTFLLAPEKSAAPARSSDASTTSLSSTGRLIGKLLRTAQQDSAPAALVGKAPLLASPAVDTKQIATALQNTLVRSGLFYESHLGQWAAGARPLAELLHEPQNQTAKPLLTEAGRATAAGSGELPPALQPSSTPTSRLLPLPSEPSSAPGTPGSNSAVVAPSPDPVVRDVPLADAPKQLVAASATPDQQEPDAAAQLATPGPESARLINLQLDALEQRRVLWQGELWPGQPLSWEVSEQAPENDADEPTPSWQSTVHFALPTLGAVAATIRLANGHVQVQVRTATDAAAHSLRLHGAELAASLEAAGVPLDALLVKQNAPD